MVQQKYQQYMMQETFIYQQNITANFAIKSC